MCKNSEEEMRPVVYLARHGETDWNRAGRWQGWTDVPLNPTGEAQALALADRLRDRAIARVVASHLARARRTAEIVAGALSVSDIGIDADLKERGFGLFEGLTREECETTYPDAWSSYRASATLPPGSEPNDVVTGRMHRAVRRATESETSDGAILVVTHGSALRAFILAATGVMPGPLSNCVLYRATVGVDAFLDVEQVDMHSK
jgi:broad specificity phosphatase PhoE